jgi:ActR/RegA family two-component response regulator
MVKKFTQQEKDMAPKKDKKLVVFQVDKELKEHIEKVAEQYEGNVSMALREIVRTHKGKGGKA